MKICLIFLTTLFSFGVVNSYKCDEKIVERIQKLWGKHGNDRHSGLLKELDESGYVIVVAGTTGLLPDEDLIDRIGARFKGNSVQNVHLYKNGTVSLNEEDLGNTILDAAKILRERLSNKVTVVVTQEEGLERELEKIGTKITFPEFQIEDVNGRDFYTEEQQRHRYYLPYDTTKAVTGFYLCEDTGVSGKPRGNIVIFSENYDQNAVTDVKKSLASVGIDIAKTYPDTFPGLI